MRATIFAAVVAALAGIAGASTLADEPPRLFPPAAPPPQTPEIDVQALLRRLEQAETRIRSLEQSHSVAPATIDPQSEASRTMAEPPARVSVMTTSTSADSGLILFDDAPNDDLSAALESIREKQAELEKQHQRLTERLGREFVIPSTKNATMQLMGRIHTDYWAFPGDDAAIREFEGMDPQDRLIFRRIRPGVRGQIGDNMLYRIELEFAEGAEPAHKDVFLGFTNLPFLQTVQIGNQKRPYGLDHINSSRYNVFMERPLVVEAFNQDTRRIGIVSYGVSQNEAWNWRYGVYQMADTQSDFGYIGDHYQPEFAGRLANTWWYDESSDGRGYAHWAIAGTLAFPDGDGGPLNSNEARFQTRPEARSEERWLNTGRIAHTRRYELLALEKVINVGPVQFVAEYQNIWLQRENARDDLFFLGGYAYLAWMLTGEHMPWDRETGQLDRIKPFENFFLVETGEGRHRGGWGAWQIALRYSHADLTNADILGGVGNSLTFGLNWYWNQNARLQFNYLHGWITDHQPVNGQTEGEYDIAGTRLMVDF